MSADGALRIVVTGLIAQYPLGGMTWHYLQYLTGLRRLGHDVYYLEDSGQWPFNPIASGLVDDCSFNVAYLGGAMNRFEMDGRWSYRAPYKSQWFGLSDEARTRVLESADVLINVSGSLAKPDLYRDIPRLIYVDSDPVFTQIKLARGDAELKRRVDLHDVHYTFGELLDRMPDTGHEWRPTRQPIDLSEWAGASGWRDSFTTVMNWTSYKPVTYEGQSFGQKDAEFKKFLDLPGVVSSTPLEIALNLGKTKGPPLELLAHKGWRVVDPGRVCADFEAYRRYIQSSKAEWSVAKNAYVVAQAGWFSERSAAYLASGRPVVTQETGFSKVLPVGQGLLSFGTIDEAAACIGDVEGNYDLHATAAREIAAEYFDSDMILGDLLERMAA